MSASSKALCACGRLSVTVATAPSTAIRTVSSAMTLRPRYILKTPKRVSETGPRAAIAKARASTWRVSAGSITPSCQSRAAA